MAGKRVLLATEFVRGGATLVRVLPLAEALGQRGHDVALAVPGGAESGFETFDAPRWAVPPPPGFVAVSYADVLMHGGYATPDSLRGLMSGWRDVLVRARPDLLVVDFAPTAMLAARVAGVAMAAVGDGFSLPPMVVPMPSMRPWAEVGCDTLSSIEGRVLAVVNARLVAMQARALGSLCELFLEVPRFLCTFPELDHYPGRADGVWYGEIFGLSGGSDPVWPGGDGERLYVELDPRHPGLPRVARALDGLGLRALLRGAGLAHALAGRLVGVTAGSSRAMLLAGCDIVVCQSQEVVAPALLAGKPVLMLPVFVEQMMILHRVAQQGLGHGVAPDSDVAVLDGALRRLVDDRACRLRAVNFGRGYDGYQPADAVEAVADGIHELLSYELSADDRRRSTHDGDD
jgi:hypothetical protein